MSLLSVFTKSPKNKKANQGQKIPASAQETLPFEDILPNGVCALGNGRFNKCIEFFDTNYELADLPDKISVFDRYEELLNGFNDKVDFQFCYLNQKYSPAEIQELISVPNASDKHDYLRVELDKFLKITQSTSTLGLIKKKFLIFTIQAPDINAATVRLLQIENQILINFKRLSAKAYPMNGIQRLNILYRTMNRHKQFTGSYQQMKRLKKSVHDMVAPEGFEFGKAGMYKLGRQVATSSLVDITAEELKDTFLTDILSCDHGMLVSIHIKVYSQQNAIRIVKQKYSDNQKMISDYKKRSAQQGLYDVSLPPDLVENDNHLLDLIDRVTSGNQKLFDTSMIVTNLSDNIPELRVENQTLQDIVGKHNCLLRPLNWQQEQGFCSSLPIGINQIDQVRELPSKSLAIAIPFIIASLFQMTKHSIYYGVDAILRKMIMADRTTLRTPNGLILGTPGSGKSFATKLEIFFTYLKNKAADLLIIDPENEYGRLVKALHGTILKLSPTAKTYINPLDISLAVDEDDGDPLVMKTDFIYSFYSLAMKRPLIAEEESIIGRCIPPIYKALIDEYKETGKENPDKVPILSDLCMELLKQPEKEIASGLVLGVEQYVKGQYKIFNNRTNVQIDSRLVCFDIQELSKSISEMGMLIVEEQLWQRVKRNRTLDKRTYAWIDEFHLLLREPKTALYSVEIWKRFRKWGGIPTGITQNIRDFLDSTAAESIIENSDFFLLFNQGSDGRDQLMKRLGISQELARYVTNSDAGTGIIIFDDKKLPFVNNFPRDNILYKLMTTNPDDLKKYKEEEKLKWEKSESDLGSVS